MNLIPLIGIPGELKVSFLNVALFVPLGFFLPILWERYRKPGRVMLFGLGMSLIIELLQMLTYRLTDVNDLITNTVGALCGFWLAKGLCRRFLPAGERSADVFILWGVSFGVMFFLHPFLSVALWDKIL